AMGNRQVSANSTQLGRAGEGWHGGRETTINFPEVLTRPSLPLPFHAKCVGSVATPATWLGQAPPPYLSESGTILSWRPQLYLSCRPASAHLAVELVGVSPNQPFS